MELQVLCCHYVGNVDAQMFAFFHQNDKKINLTILLQLS